MGVEYGASCHRTACITIISLLLYYRTSSSDYYNLNSRLMCLTIFS